MWRLFSAKNPKNIKEQFYCYIDQVCNIKSSDYYSTSNIVGNTLNSLSGYYQKSLYQRYSYYVKQFTDIL